MLRRFTRIVSGMVVYPARMIENLARSRGVVFSGSVLLELASAASRASRPMRGSSATRCGRSRSSATSRTLLLADADVTKVLARRTLIDRKHFDVDGSREFSERPGRICD